MQRVVCFADTESQMEIQLVGENGEEKIITEDVVDLNLIWSDCHTGPDLPTDYERFRQALSTRWGFTVNRATAYFVMEKHAEIIANLKKTHFISESSPS